MAAATTTQRRRMFQKVGITAGEEKGKSENTGLSTWGMGENGRRRGGANPTMAGGRGSNWREKNNVKLSHFTRDSVSGDARGETGELKKGTGNDRADERSV